MSSKRIIILTLILLNKAFRVFRSFVTIRGAGARSKHKQRSSYKFPSHWKRIYSLVFCLQVCQNRHILYLSLSKSRFESLPFWNVAKVWNYSEIWDLLQDDDLHPSCLLRTNCSEIPQVLISPFELHLSSTFPTFVNLLVAFPLDSSLLIGEGHIEKGFGRKEFWNPTKWTKYSHLELVFLNFLNKVLVFLSMELVSLWHGIGF